MRELLLTRLQTGDHGTLGVLSDEDGAKLCYTLEPPWRDNARGLSCIPLGTYHMAPHYSPKFGEVYLLKNVEGRSAILTHRGNLGGDRLKGLITHTEGCILVGQKIGSLHGQTAVLASYPAFSSLMDELDGEYVMLKIDAQGEST